MDRRLLVAAVVGLGVISSATALPAATEAGKTVAAHKLIVVVEKSPTRAADRKLAVLVLIRQNGGAPAGAVATPSKPLTVHLDNSRFYRVTAEIDSSCKGGCDARYRISGSADHKLEVVPTCRLDGSGFVCSKLRIVRIY